MSIQGCRSVAVRMWAVAVMLVAAACGDDPVEPVQDLTKEEAIALFTQMKTVVQVDTAAPIHASEDSIVLRCLLGGQMKSVLSFRGDSIEGGTRITIDQLAVPRACKLTGTGPKFTVDGDPSLRDVMTVDYVLRQDSFVVEVGGSIVGGLAWKLEDENRSGECKWDVKLTGRSLPDKPQIRQTHKGTLCGHEVEIESVVDIEDASQPPSAAAARAAIRPKTRAGPAEPPAALRSRPN